MRNPEMFLVAMKDNLVITKLMAWYEGYRDWIHPDFQVYVIGKCLMDEAEILFRAAGCPNINLQVRSMIELYIKLEFRMEDVMSLGKQIKPLLPQCLWSLQTYLTHSPHILALRFYFADLLH